MTFAAIIAAMAQIALCGDSLVEVRFGPDAKAHVEQKGIHVHHAHDEADCAACTARHLLATSQPEAPARALVVESAQHLRTDNYTVVATTHQTDARSRAPPSLIA